jgi:FRG domain-containing protein
VTSELELIRIIGALRWHNPGLELWFRGEPAYFSKALPSRIRDPKSGPLTPLGLGWLDSKAGHDRALRDRSPLARVAVLQHYGCPTSLLDLSASYDVACAFAFASPVAGQSHLRIYATPRQRAAVSVFDDADVVLVDLRAELPSYCARPHVQQAAFLARREAVLADVSFGVAVEEPRGSVDGLCIAHLKLSFNGRARFYEPRIESGVLYPQAGTACFRCSGKPDMNGDYLLHILNCYGDSEEHQRPRGFPDAPSHMSVQKPLPNSDVAADETLGRCAPSGPRS